MLGVVSSPLKHNDQKKRSAVRKTRDYLPPVINPDGRGALDATGRQWRKLGALCAELGEPVPTNTFTRAGLSAAIDQRQAKLDTRKRMAARAAGDAVRTTTPDSRRAARRREGTSG